MGLKASVTTIFMSGVVLFVFLIGAATFALGISLLIKGKSSNTVEQTCGVCPSVTYKQCLESVLFPEEHAENAD
jgi:hypothetical protein